MCKLSHDICTEAITYTARVVVEKHRRLRNRIRDGFEMTIELVMGRLQEHRLKDGNAGCAVCDGHLGEADALLRIDGTDAEVNRHTTSGLIHHDLETALHLVLLELIELAVGTERQDALKASIDDIIHLLPHAGLIDLLILIDDGNNRNNYTLDKLCIHENPLSDSIIIILIDCFSFWTNDFLSYGKASVQTLSGWIFPNTKSPATGVKMEGKSARCRASDQYEAITLFCKITLRWKHRSFSHSSERCRRDRRHPRRGSSAPA